MFPRTILRKIDLYLHTRDILLFYGARQVGKTSLMKMIQSTTQERKSYFFDLENPDYFDLFEQGPTQFIAYLKSYYGWEESTQILVLIDEVQYLSHPTQLLKYLHDHYENIKLIVSGSSTLEIRGKLQDSLVGRMLRFDIYPLSFEEFLVFKGKESL